jgi:hypothetical protein
MRDFTVKQVQAAAPGRHRVSPSLYLYVAPNGQTARWLFRFTKPPTHSEFYFSDVDWPEFRRVDFLRAIRSFQQRSRRFGR